MKEGGKISHFPLPPHQLSFAITTSLPPPVSTNELTVFTMIST